LSIIGKNGFLADVGKDCRLGVKIFIMRYF